MVFDDFDLFQNLQIFSNFSSFVLFVNLKLSLINERSHQLSLSLNVKTLCESYVAIDFLYLGQHTSVDYEQLSMKI